MGATSRVVESSSPQQEVRSSSTPPRYEVLYDVDLAPWQYYTFSSLYNQTILCPQTPTLNPKS